jgi:flagellar biosynthetic protein FlhB
MAEDRDDSQRTEDPTQKRLADARERGESPRSQDVVVFATLSAATLGIVVWGGQAGREFVSRFTAFLAQPHEFDSGGEGILHLAWQSAFAVAAMIALPVVAMMVAAIIGNVAQAPLVWSGERMKWDITKLSPAKGFGRLFGGEAWVNFAKGLVKVACAATAGVWAVWPNAGALMALVSSDPGSAGAAAWSLSIRMLGAMLVVVAIFAAIDLAWQRFSFLRRMRMSRQEIRDEMKQSEGDPLVKMKIRQVRMERGRKRMMAEVPRATVVVTNPTHYAVALKYESGTMAAPKCVAKGVDALALRIREIANDSKVPIVENPPLARALYAAVEVDADIPVEHYKAVAQIIGFIMRQRSKS